MDEFTRWYFNESDKLNSKGKQKRKAILNKLHEFVIQKYIDEKVPSIKIRTGTSVSANEKRVAVREVFTAYDSDGNGTLDKDEFTEMCRRLGLNLNADQVKKEFKNVDKDGSGTIEFEEFFSWWNNKRNGISVAVRKAVDNGIDRAADYKSEFVKVEEKPKKGGKGGKGGKAAEKKAPAKASAKKEAEPEKKKEVKLEKVSKSSSSSE